jgi:hypothetical protein
MRTRFTVLLITVVVVAALAAFVLYSRNLNWQGQNNGGGTVPTVGTYVPASVPPPTVPRCTPGYSSNPECPDFVPAPGTPGNSG